MCINETYSEVRVAKLLSDALPNQNGMKEVDALSLFIFTSVLEYDIKKEEKNQVGTKLNGTHQRLVLAKQEGGLEVKAEKTVFVFISREQYAGQTYSVKIAILKKWQISNFSKRH